MNVLFKLFLVVLLQAPVLVFGQASGKLQIHFMDVGQGDGALLITPLGETVLFDDGAAGNCDKPLAYMHKLGVTHIDYHIASHYHSDHIGCALQVLHDFPLKKAAYDRGSSYDSSVYGSYLSAVGSFRKTANPGLRLTLDQNQSPSNQVVIEIVAANATTEDGKIVDTSNENDLSVSAVIHFGGFGAEIGGDLSGYKNSNYEDIETDVAPKVGQIEVYKVHHHGSRYSSNKHWLAITKPQIGIVSCGDGNRYNHPTSECLESLHEAGVKTYWTETGNGVAPDPEHDLVGGTIVVEVPSDTKTYSVSYQGGKTDQYAVRNVAPSIPPMARVTAASRRAEGSGRPALAALGGGPLDGPSNATSNSPPPAGNSSVYKGGGPCEMLCVLLLGALLGACGQIARVIVGIKKEMDTASSTAPKKNWDDWFNIKQLVFSLVLGAVAGALATAFLLDGGIDKKFVMACITAGYAGSDFIEGFITKSLPPVGLANVPAARP